MATTRLRRSFRLCSLLAFVFVAAPTNAQQLSILSGITQERPTHDDSFAYVADYSEPISKLFSYSLVYVNEGHLIDHHRDGVGAQLWAGLNITPRWSIKAGVGPYLFFDTAATSPGRYSDEHGWGLISSASTNYQLTPHWAVEFRANRIITKKSIDTNSFLVGFGYTFDASVLPGSSAGRSSWQSDGARPNEVTAFIARTYVNDFESPTATGYQVEYRRQLSRNFEWTIAALREGAPGPLNRSGALTEVWATRRLFNDRATMGIGLGPYLAYDSVGENRIRLSGVLSLTASLNVAGNVTLRALWHRIATRYDHDTDVFLLGAGYRW